MEARRTALRGFRTPRSGATAGAAAIASSTWTLGSIMFDAREHHFPFVPTTAPGGLLLRAPARIDFPPPFALAPNADDFTLYLDGEGSDDPITVEYFSMPIRPPAQAAP